MRNSLIHSVTLTRTKLFRLTLISILLTVALAAMPVIPAGAVGTQVTLTSGTSWTVPAGVTNITIECWGAGGNGGGATWFFRIGGGGGGGAYAKVLSYAVTPGQVIPISIGTSGGADTIFNTNVCVADGGANGTAGTQGGGNGAGGAGGLASASIGDITANGGSGSYAGGGSAGVTALGLLSATAIAGNNASACTGAGAVANGGAGGNSNCSSQTVNGGAGGFPGGGGGGGSMGGGGSTTSGGAGGDGKIVITYLPSITTPTATNIGTTSATLGANFVSANGAMTVSARGICWGTSPAPTTNCASSGTTTGVYTQSVSGFTAGTLYYYRGYVTVESGTGYSEDGTFTADTTLAVTAPSSVTSPTTGTLTASGGLSGGTVSFDYVSGGCSLGGANNATLTITNVSNTPCVVTATRAAGGNYVAQTSANFNVTLEVPPSVNSFARQTPAASPTNADTLVFRATFNEAVQNVDATDFAVTGTTATVTDVASVGAGPTYTQYDLTVSGGNLATLDGTVGINLAGGQNITDLVGNALPAGEPATDETYTVDNTAPTLNSFARQTPATSLTNADTLVFRATFSEAVQNMDATDFAVTGTTATVIVSGVGAGPTYTQYDITVSGGDLTTLNGIVGINLASGQNITDLTGNALPAGEPATDETYTMVYNATQVTFTTGTSWTVPAGVTNISIECWGGGGGGGNRTLLNGRGGGGGGGAYAKVLSYAVTPGAVIPYSIGAGGGSAGNGGNTTFNTNICVAAGGSRGVTNGAGGAGGLASASTGDIKADGGSGAQNGSGSSAGVTALGLASATAIAGNNASVCTGGAAVTNGGTGRNGNCANQTINGTDGGFPGGGGSGASMGGGGFSPVGGAGAQGRIVITYEASPSVTTPTVTDTGTTSDVKPVSQPVTISGVPVGASGGTFNLPRSGQLVIPPNLMANGSVLKLESVANITLNTPNGLHSLFRVVNAQIFNSAGTEIKSFTPPLQLCYTFTDAELANIGGDARNFVIITSSDGKTWEELATTVDTANKKVCASVTHFSLFELAARAPTEIPTTGDASMPWWMWVIGLLGGGVVGRFVIRRKTI